MKVYRQIPAKQLCTGNEFSQCSLLQAGWQNYWQVVGVAWCLTALNPAAEAFMLAYKVELAQSSMDSNTCSQRWHTLSAHGFKQCEPLQMMSLWMSDDSVFLRANETSSWHSMLQHEALCTVITTAKFTRNWWYLFAIVHAITQMWQFYYLATHFYMLAFALNLPC